MNISTTRVLIRRVEAHDMCYTECIVCRLYRAAFTLLRSAEAKE